MSDGISNNYSSAEWAQANPCRYRTLARRSLSLFLHLCSAWPVGVIGLALSSSLVSAGVPVQRVGAILAAVSFAFTLEFVWAPMVDSSLTRRRWFAVGTAVMCGCLVALLVAPWRAAAVPLLTLLAFCASSGAAVAAVSVKGIMAHEVPALGLAPRAGTTLRVARWRKPLRVRER